MPVLRRPTQRDFQAPGRSEILGTDCMVSAPHPQAALVAFDTLRNGGNAVDAAIAATAVLAVVDPTQTGIGGDCFAIYRPQSIGKVIAINGSGWAPREANTDRLLEHGISSIADDSPLAVTIPGAIAAWQRLLDDHGRLGLNRVLQPAIALAETGYLITERVARDWKRKVKKLSKNPNAKRIFLNDGTPPAFGTLHKQPELATALKSIARDGSDAFYRGWIAEDIVSTLRAIGGVHTLSDLDEYKAEYVTPVYAAYRGYDVWQCPPNGVGIVVLMMLRAIEGIDISAFSPQDVRRMHLIGEFGRMAYSTRGAVLGDPRTSKVSLDYLLSDTFANEMRRNFSPITRSPFLKNFPGIPNHRDTVAVAVVDKDMNAISLINSNFDDFGSGIVTNRSGIVLQNRGCGFVIERGHPNTIEGRKRPAHTIIPGLVTRGDQIVMPFAVTGGQYQPAGQVCLITHLIDDGLSLQDAIDQPRFFSKENEIELEIGFSSSVTEELERYGYNVIQATEPLGCAQAVWVDHSRGVLHGAADGRRDGVALGW